MCWCALVARLLSLSHVTASLPLPAWLLSRASKVQRCCMTGIRYAQVMPPSQTGAVWVPMMPGLEAGAGHAPSAQEGCQQQALQPKQRWPSLSGSSTSIRLSSTRSGGIRVSQSQRRLGFWLAIPRALKLRSKEPARVDEGRAGDSTALQRHQASIRGCCQAPAGGAHCCSSQLVIEQLEVRHVVPVQAEVLASCVGRQFWVMMHACVRGRVVCAAVLVPARQGLGKQW